MKKIASLILLLVTLTLVIDITACAKRVDLPTETQTYSLHNVHSLTINGPYVVNVHNGSKVSQMTLYGTRVQLQNITVKQVGEEVTVNDLGPIPDQARPVVINVAIPNLRNLKIQHAQSAYIDAGKRGYFDLTLHDVKQLTYAGSAVLPIIKFDNNASLVISEPTTVHTIYRSGQGNIVLSRAQGSNISIYNEAGGGVFLDGNTLGFNELVQTGNGEIRIQTNTPITHLNSVACSQNGRIYIHTPLVKVKQLWVKSLGKSEISFNNVQASWIKADLSDHSRVWLAGKIDKLNVTLDGRSQLYAPNLKAQIVYISAYDKSYARFTVKHTLFANATDQSILEYFGHPKERFARVERRALVLPLDAPL